MSNGTPFKTDTRYLDKHKEHLERTNNIVEWAQKNPESRNSVEILKENQEPSNLQDQTVRLRPEVREQLALQPQVTRFNLN